MIGKDIKGRSGAQTAVHMNGGGRVTVLNVLVLLGLLVLPALAMHRLALDLRWAGIYVVVMGTVAYGAYAVDKRRARANEWRLSEAGLHALEVLGGWPGAFLAQQRLRHKCSKRSYQFMFWLIVLAYQFAAFDSLQSWKLSRATAQWILAWSKHR